MAKNRSMVYLIDDWVQIDLGKDAEDADHFISPEERLRIAMARQ